jgi:predicted dehydrogenase
MIALGTIGAGRWGGNWIRTLANLPEAELRWCCDVSDVSLEKVRRQYPQIKTTTRFDDVLEDDTLAGIVIATSASTHFDLARRALLVGKHVLVEKPMTLASAEAVELTDLAQHCQRVLMVGHLLEYHPVVGQIKEMMDRGELGDVFCLYSERLNLGTIRADENAWWSLAPHDISVACRLLNSTPVSVQCRGQNIIRQNVADIVFATLTFPAGQIAHVHISWLDPNKSRKLTVVGSRMSAVFDDTAEHKLVVHDRGFERIGEVVTLRQGGFSTPAVDPTDPLTREAQHFIDCIRNGKRPISDGASGTAVVSVLAAGQASLDRGGEDVAVPRRL